MAGSRFATPPQLVGTIHGADMSLALPGGCSYYCYYGLPQTPAVIENVADNRFLALSGLITATAGRSSITGTLSGEFILMKSATPPLDIVATCSNEHHRVTFTK